MKRTKSWLLLDLGIKLGSGETCAVIFLILLLISCNSTKFEWKNKRLNERTFIPEQDSILLWDGISRNRSYGYSPYNPIKLGVINRALALTYPLKYFNSIAGPNGEKISAIRVKSCCPFKTINSEEYPYQNLAVLEIYRVIIENTPEPVYLYINFFDDGEALAPKGFTPKKAR
jgi:hypothetical protein